MWPRSRIARAALAVVLVCAVAIAAAPFVIRGRTAGAIVERLLPAMRGRVHIGKARWGYGTLLALARGRAAAVELEDVHLDDPSGVEVLRVRRLAGQLELSRGPRRVVVRELVLEQVHWRFVDRGDGGGTGFLQALRAPARPPGPSSDGAPFGFSIVNARIVDLTAWLVLPSWAVTLGGVSVGAASLSYVPGRRDAFTFEVRGAESRQGGNVRIGAGATPWSLSFDRARLDRVATTSAAPDAIHLEASEIARGESRLAVRGTFAGVYGLSAAPESDGVDLEVTVERAAGVLGALAENHQLGSSLHLGGPAARVSAKVVGPYRDVRLFLDAQELSVRHGPIDLFPVAFRLEAAPLTGRYRATEIRIGWRDAGVITGALAFDVHGGAVSVGEMELAFGRPAGSVGARLLGLTRSGPPRKRPVRGGEPALHVPELKFVDGEVRARRLTLPVLGGTLEVSGGLRLRDQKTGRWLTKPVVDASLTGRGLSAGELLGSRFVRGKLSFNARVRGPTTALRCEVNFPQGAGLSVLGEPLALPRALRFTYTDGAAYLHVDLVGTRGARIRVTGRIEDAWRADLDIRIRDFPFSRLPGVSDTGLAFGGPIWGQLKLTGELDAPALVGNLEIYPMRFQGRDAGMGKIFVSTDRSGALWARGQLMNGVSLDGWLRAEGGAARGEATLTLDRVETDALGIAVPGDIGVRGVVSGVLVARVAPGRPSGIEGRFSALTLHLTPPHPSAIRAAALELHAAGPVDVSIQADGEVALEPARFTGVAGDFVLALRSRREGALGSVRGRVELAPFAAFLAPWVESPVGTVAVELIATRRTADGPFAIDGAAAVRGPVSFRIAGEPVDLRIPSGGVRLVDGILETSALPVSFVAVPSSALPVRRAAGSVHVDGRFKVTTGDPVLRARVAVGNVELAIPRIGSLPVAVAGGHFSFDGPPGDLGRLAFTDVDLPLRGTARRVTTPAGTIDRALFDLRLRAPSSRDATLSGDIDVLGAHVTADQRAAAVAHTGEAGRTEEVAFDNPRLDLNLRSRRGAVAIELEHVPDLHLAVDLHVGGTLARPAVTGQSRPEGIYSTIVLALRRLFE